MRFHDCEIFDLLEHLHRNGLIFTGMINLLGWVVAFLNEAISKFDAGIMHKPYDVKNHI